MIRVNFDFGEEEGSLGLIGEGVLELKYFFHRCHIISQETLEIEELDDHTRGVPCQRWALFGVNHKVIIDPGSSGKMEKV